MTHKKTPELLIVVLSLFLLPTENLSAKEYQSIDGIQAAIVQFIQNNIDTSQEYTIRTKKLDSRLKLPKCTTPLETYSHKNQIVAGLLSIGVRCNGKHRWSLFNSAKLTIFKKVLMLKHDLKRNAIISKENVSLEKLSTTKLHRGYFTDYKQIKNLLATRNLRAGVILRPSHLTTARLVKKGEKVTILASSPSFSIKMHGRALMDGSLGEQIRVKNNKSKKIIEGTIIKAGIISVNY